MLNDIHKIISKCYSRLTRSCHYSCNRKSLLRFYKILNIHNSLSTFGKKIGNQNSKHEIQINKFESQN